MGSDASRVGLMLSGRQPVSDFLVIARAAEDAGFHSLWSGDGGGDVFSLLSIWAINTSRIHIGSSVAVWHRPPVIAASAAAQLQAMSSGRFIFGIGAGPRDWNENWWGINFDRPIGRMREYIEVIRGVLSSPSGEQFSYAGNHFRIRDYRRPGRPPADLPPIWLGTVGPQMNRLVGRIADGVEFDVCLSRRYLRDVALPAVMEGLAQRGRERSAVTIAAAVPCVVHRDSKLALRGIKGSISGHLTNEYFYPTWRGDGFEAEARRAHDRLAAGDRVGTLDALSDDFAAAVGIAGSPDECRRQLAEWLEIVDKVILFPPSQMLPDDEIALNRRAIIETFGAG